MRAASLVKIHARAVAVVALATLAGCLKSTEPQASVLQLSGSWNYVATQTSPVQENITGTLTISRESGTSFQGRLDAVGTNPQTGSNRLLSGLVSGSEQGGNVIDFDAEVEMLARRHVGQIVADTITGTWVGSSSDGSVISGAFRAQKETP